MQAGRQRTTLDHIPVVEGASNWALGHSHSRSSRLLLTATKPFCGQTYDGTVAGGSNAAAVSRRPSRMGLTNLQCVWSGDQTR